MNCALGFWNTREMRPVIQVSHHKGSPHISINKCTHVGTYIYIYIDYHIILLSFLFVLFLVLYIIAFVTEGPNHHILKVSLLTKELDFLFRFYGISHEFQGFTRKNNNRRACVVDIKIKKVSMNEKYIESRNTFSLCIEIWKKNRPEFMKFIEGFHHHKQLMKIS